MNKVLRNVSIKDILLLRLSIQSHTKQPTDEKWRKKAKNLTRYFIHETKIWEENQHASFSSTRHVKRSASTVEREDPEPYWKLERKKHESWGEQQRNYKFLKDFSNNWNKINLQESYKNFHYSVQRIVQRHRKKKK